MEKILNLDVIKICGNISLLGRMKQKILKWFGHTEKTDEKNRSELGRGKG